MHQRTRSASITTLLRDLYEGGSKRAIRFRYALFLFDVMTLVFLVVASFDRENPLIGFIDSAIGLIIFAEFAARLLVSRHRLHDLFHPLGLADVAVIVSFLAPFSLGFLRSLRVLRLFRSYRTANRMQRDFPFVRRNYDTITAGINLFVFLFVATAIVYETQHQNNAEIGNYLDALYFTVTTLTTTGFGDITLSGTTGRLLSIAMMLVGVGLFLRMLQVLLRPRRLRHRCSSCGLAEHDTDAVHCKRCGALLVIPAQSATPSAP